MPYLTGTSLDVIGECTKAIKKIPAAAEVLTVVLIDGARVAFALAVGAFIAGIVVVTRRAIAPIGTSTRLGIDSCVLRRIWVYAGFRSVWLGAAAV
ncbi:MAG: hypothetical protein GY822_18455 [Deltaproteobacteria bacterium]|nr:hypothetical protein [Deltaproteobacteria bacterium]